MGSYEAVKVRLDPTPSQGRLMASHAGAARFAYNAGLAHVKEALDNGDHADWSHYGLIRWWNANKDELAAPVSVSAPRGGVVGVDLGVKNLATLSDGTVIPNPRALGARLKALRKAQQALSRKVMGSNRREKAKERVAKLHARVADARADVLNKATTMIASNYSVVRIEDLNVAGMVKNRSIARSLSDAALGEFRRQLEYKTARSGAALRVVDRWYPSSKTCSNCGTVKAKLSLSERTFNCDACGASMDRDLNAAINIEVAGSAPETLNARGGGRKTFQLISLLGDADPGEARTKRAQKSAVRLGAGLGNEVMQIRMS